MKYRLYPKVIVMLALGLLSIGVIIYAQTTADVDNPTGVTFVASTDHAVIDGYDIDIVNPQGTVIQTINAGKPTPNASNIVTVPLNVQPIAFGDGYTVVVRARAGSVSSTGTVSVNKFNRKPTDVSNVTLVKQ